MEPKKPIIQHTKIVHIIAGVIDLELATIKPLNKKRTPKIPAESLMRWYNSLVNLDPVVTIDYDNSAEKRKQLFDD